MSTKPQIFDDSSGQTTDNPTRTQIPGPSEDAEAPRLADLDCLAEADLIPGRVTYQAPDGHLATLSGGITTLFIGSIPALAIQHSPQEAIAIRWGRVEHVDGGGL